MVCLLKLRSAQNSPNLDLLRNLLSTNMLLVESSPRYLCPGIGAAVSMWDSEICYV